jgi:hypothetical protein
MKRLKLLKGFLVFDLFSLLHQTLRNFLITRSLTAAIILVLGSRLLGGTRLSWLFPG